jgi:hypothetical protein
VERGYQPRLIALSIVPNYLPERLYGVPCFFRNASTAFLLSKSDN